MTRTSLGLIFPASTAAWQASSDSKTRAVPVWWMRSRPVTLMTAPSGRRLPRMMTKPPVVLRGFAGEDLAGAHVALAEVENHSAGLTAGLSFASIHRGDAGEVKGRDAEELAGHRHCVGGELAAAGSRAGTGCGFEGFEFGVIYF